MVWVMTLGAVFETKVFLNFFVTTTAFNFAVYSS